MKKLYIVAGLICILFFQENRVDAVGQQDITFAIDNSARVHECNFGIRTKSILATFIRKLNGMEPITGDANGKLKPPAEPVDAANHVIKLTNNLTDGMVEKKKVHPPSTSSMGLFFWFFAVFAAISALSFLLFLFLKQKKKHRMQLPLATARQDDSPDSHPQAKLVYMGNARLKDSIFIFDRNKVTIGRATENAIVIPDSTVSALHATIQYKNGHFQLEDHNSLNGTFLRSNHLPPNRPVNLKHGDIIKFATFTFHFLRVDRPPSEATLMMAKILKFDN